MLSARHGILSPAQQLAKEYRTEIAASASSCVSTFVAVGRSTVVVFCLPSRHADRVPPSPVSTGLSQDSDADVSAPSNPSFCTRDCVSRGRENDELTCAMFVCDRYKFRSFWDCVTQTKKTEGMRGFWRGMRHHASIILRPGFLLPMGWGCCFSGNPLLMDPILWAHIDR